MPSASDSDAKGDSPINTVHDTQPFYDPCDGDDENLYVENTVPFDFDIDGDDTLLLSEEETEPLCLAGETQRLDEFDYSDGDCDTQLFDEERDADGTEVLENIDSVDPHCVDTAQSQDTTAEKKKILEESDAVLRRNTNSGSMPPRYTFLRAESLRQAALATRNMAFKQTQIETNSVMDVSQSCRETLAVNDNGEHVPTHYEKLCGVGEENYREKDSVEIPGSMDKNMCKIACTAVRKLFNDDLTFETNDLSHMSNDLNEEDSLDKLPIYHDDLAGLSYIDSQEPGDLSQINALDFVDKFLKDNFMDLDQEIGLVKNVEEQSKSLPPSKGRQSLAKRVSDRGKSGETGIYDWDDNCEDEGGGDIFLRRKEDFYDGGIHKPKSLPVLQKIKVCRSSDDNDAKQSSFPKRRKIIAHSDTKPGMLNLKVRDNNVQEATRTLKRNLANELDEQFKTDCFGGEVEPNPKADVQELLDVGIDTQIAAEAMEALCNASDIVDNVARVTRSRETNQLDRSTTVKAGPVISKECSRQYGRKRKVNEKSDLQTSGLSNKSTKTARQSKKDNVMTRSMRSKLNAGGNRTCSVNENDRIVSSPINEQRKSAETLKIHQLDELNNINSNSSGGRTVNNNKIHREVCHFTPIARRTRQSRSVNHLIKSDISSKSLGGDIANGSHEKRSGIGCYSSKALDTKSTPGSFDHFEVDDNSELCELETLASKASAVSVSDDVEMGTIDFPKRRRSIRIRKLSSNGKGSEKLAGPSKSSAQPEDIGQSTASMAKMRTGTRSVVKPLVNCRTQSSLYGGSEISSIDQRQRKALEPNLDKVTTGDTDDILSTNNFEVTNSDESPRERYKSCDSAFATPANCKTLVSDASPVCMGDGYCKRSLNRELRSLSAIKPELSTPSKDSRKRRDMTDVRILYSHHLDADIVKHQRKILSRLGVTVSSSIADATHFIADQFVRTRNMLEAIAYGKPVVTHLWIDSCGQASCFIDERSYILRDAKKEKEIGFSMPVSLAHASQHPLLEGRKVLITPNAKPSKEIILSLVKAVQGQAVERVGRSALKDHKFPDDLLILSCEQDYSSCVPFLEKGAMVCTSELLLNGIVTQKLEYERHRLFADQVKKTRSTIWLKKDEKTFLPVTKCS